MLNYQAGREKKSSDCLFNRRAEEERGGKAEDAYRNERGVRERERVRRRKRGRAKEGERWERDIGSGACFQARRLSLTSKRVGGRRLDEVQGHEGEKAARTASIALRKVAYFRSPVEDGGRRTEVSGRARESSRC